MSPTSRKRWKKPLLSILSTRLVKGDRHGVKGKDIVPLLLTGHLSCRTSETWDSLSARRPYQWKRNLEGGRGRATLTQLRTKHGTSLTPNLPRPYYSVTVSTTVVAGRPPQWSKSFILYSTGQCKLKVLCLVQNHRPFGYTIIPFRIRFCNK